MKVGIVSDIHGNLPALESAISSLHQRGVDALLCTGDIVGIYGYNKECLTTIQNQCDAIVIGNHDRRATLETEFSPQTRIEEIEAEMTTQQLSETDREWLWSLPEEDVFEETIKLVHSHPDKEIRWTENDRIGTADYPKLGKYTERCSALCFGHTHTQHAVVLNKFPGQSGLALNPGSVGVPYTDAAQFAILNSTDDAWCEDDYTLCSTEYDSDRVKQRLTQLGVHTELTQINQNRRKQRRTV